MKAEGEPAAVPLKILRLQCQWGQGISAYMCSAAGASSLLA